MSINSSAKITRLMRQILPLKGHSFGKVWIIGMDGDHNINVIDRTSCSPEEFNVFSTTLGFDIHEPYRIAYSKGAVSMFLIHSHAKGDVKPSKEDFRFTHRQIKGAKSLSILLVDHIIIAGDDHYSMADNGTLGMPEDLLYLV